MILPPSTLAMLGGGQLGRFFVAAAHEMGYAVWVLDPDAESPAGRIADRHLSASYDDPEALAEIARHAALEDHLEIALRDFEQDHSRIQSIVAWPWIINTLLN